MRGRVFDFQRYAIHDGPGIRSVLFLSDCSLRCAWCCNPESFAKNWASNQYVEVADVISWLVEDKPYFLNSGGGVTVSGGEPLLQVEFLKSFLFECRQQGIGTAVETCGEVPWDSFESISGLIDYYLYDVKVLDKNIHKKYTGRDNARILDNLRRLVDKKEKIFLRIPLIPNLNINKDFAEGIGRLASEINAAEIHLLPYHRFGEKKYAELNIEPPEFDPENIMRTSRSKEMIEEFASIIQNYNNRIIIGG